MLCRLPEEWIQGSIDPLTDAAVVFIQIKISVPEAEEVLFGTVQLIETLTCIQFSDIQAGITCKDTVCAGVTCIFWYISLLFSPLLIYRICRRSESVFYNAVYPFPAETLPALRYFFQIKIIRYLCDQPDLPPVF